jgi:hypothetical protein
VSGRWGFGRNFKKFLGMGLWLVWDGLGVLWKNSGLAGLINCFDWFFMI